MKAKLMIVGLLFFGMTAHVPAAPRLDASQTKAGDLLKSAFKDVVAEANRSTVLVRCDGKDAALGAVVTEDGCLVTKASELTGKVTVRMRDGKELPAKLLGVVSQHDLAMLKVEGGNFVPVAWGDSRKAEVGQWVAAAGVGEKPLAVGVISVGRRKIPAQSGMLGVVLQDADGAGAKIMQVGPDTAAQKAGLTVDDIVTKVNGKAGKTRAEIADFLHEFRPGDRVVLTVKRGEKTLEVDATLTGPVVIPIPGQAPAPRRDVQRILAGPVSKRAADFPVVLQHDTILRPAECGGPLVDLDGKAVGINIARGGRTESYALPADVILPLIPELKAGKYPAPKLEATSVTTAPPAATASATTAPAKAEGKETPKPEAGKSTTQPGTRPADPPTTGRSGRRGRVI